MVKYLISPNFINMEFCHNLFRIAIVSETEDFMTGEWTISNFDSGKWEAHKNNNELDLNAQLRLYQKVPVSV